MIKGKIGHTCSKRRLMVLLFLLVTILLPSATPVRGVASNDRAKGLAPASALPPVPDRQTDPTSRDHADSPRAPVTNTSDFWDAKVVTASATDSGDVVPDAIDAVVVRSWGGCGSAALLWESLNANWFKYGEIPIEIDYSNPDLCGGVAITYAALAASGADVVVISDPAGAPEQYTQDEISAIAAYAGEGHNIIGTFILFQWREPDNRELAPLFGLFAATAYTVTDVVPTYTMIDDTTSPLFFNLASTYASHGWPRSQVPADDTTWNARDLNGARFVAINAASDAAILLYDGPGYRAIYITTMPEYRGGTKDEQFLYNAITYPASRGLTKHYLPLLMHNG